MPFPGQLMWMFPLPVGLRALLHGYLSHMWSFGQVLLHSFPNPLWAGFLCANIRFESELSFQIVPCGWPDGGDNVSHLLPCLRRDIFLSVAPAAPLLCKHFPIVNISQTS